MVYTYISIYIYTQEREIDTSTTTYIYIYIRRASRFHGIHETWDAFWVLILLRFRRRKKVFLKGFQRVLLCLRGFDRAGPWKVSKAQTVLCETSSSKPFARKAEALTKKVGSKPVVKWACFLGCAGTSFSLPGKLT